jgi:Fimbrial assembly protein (PilN)
VSSLLGVSVAGATLHAVLVRNGAIVWAGAATHRGPADLADALARLASEPAVPARRVRLVFERDVVQLRAVMPAPPLKAEALRRYVALEAPRLFRKNGERLVTDGIRLAPTPDGVALWAGAVAEPLVEAAVAGCTQAGLRIEAIGPAADVLAAALRDLPDAGELSFPNGGTTEVLSWKAQSAWRSRLVSGSPPVDVAWHAALAPFGADAPHLAAAFAATRTRTRLDFSPPSMGLVRLRRDRRRRRTLAALAATLWLGAAGVYTARLAMAGRAMRRELNSAAAAVDTALALRRNLDQATAALSVIGGAERHRSRQVALLATLTRVLRDSAYLVALRSEPDGTVRLVGYAPAATRVLAQLEGAHDLAGAKLEGPVTREAPAGGGEMDRFSIVARRRWHGAAP